MANGSHLPRQIVEMMVEGSAISIFANACEYREATILLMSAYNGRILERMFRPLYHMAGICVELMLKAFLLNAGMERQKVQRLSHDLGKLLDAAVASGLLLDEVHCADICRMSATAKNAYFRYGLDRGDQKPPYSVQIPYIQGVATAIEALSWRVSISLG